MGSALTSALSGLRAHQLFLDVVGNNLANSSTVGFKSSRLTFADTLSETLRTGSAPTSTVGGVDPVQIGLGVQVHSDDLLESQGVLDQTGRPFDLGIQGDGFFVVSSGTHTYYTRAGTFGLDSNNFMVDTATGYRVQNVNGTDIQIPINTLLPAKATTTINLGGNLPAKVTGPVAEVLTSAQPLQDGTHAVLTGGTSGPFTLVDGDTMDVRVDGGAVQTITFRAADFTAIGSNIASASATDVATIINQQLTGATADGSSGSVVITSGRTGADSTLKIDDGTGSPASILGLSTTLTRGTQFAATAATQLNNLADNTVDYVNGDKINISGTDAAGQAVAGTFVYGTNGTTVGDLVTLVNSLYPDATASLDASGNIVLTANQVGTASVSMSISDDSTSTGQTTFASHGFAITTAGTGPDQARTSIDVFDTRGLQHTVTLTFTRVNDVEWDMTATTNDPNDVVIDGSVQGIRFNSDGSFSSVTGSGTGDGDIEIQFAGAANSQTIGIGMGTSGQLDGVTQLGDTTTLGATSQDGYAVGELVSVAVGSDGTINGSYSNGQQQKLDQVALAVFSNPEGLIRHGNSLFDVSLNSGAAQIQQAGNGRAGTISGGSLESSNVDVAQEFVRLIEAQRGFQANARVIKASDDLLSVLVNIV